MIHCSKELSSFMVLPLAKAGAVCAVLGYELAPKGMVIISSSCENCVDSVERASLGPETIVFAIQSTSSGKILNSKNLSRDLVSRPG